MNSKPLNKRRKGELKRIMVMKAAVRARRRKAGLKVR